ncbi:MAG: hypothetical protein Unbinned664contig1000_62 [Prokaryotic dsDNA virus sp.]|nr:MAG: hypothetical protein Unbinned664contig1000_62 [Prokaryotic dsDNA virus sp.]|tara:strand:- start:14649 stop:15059 length:411 start_codon:yes stop_codon:yes gene_type:complete
MLVKVSELKGRALNYAVAVCEYDLLDRLDNVWVFDRAEGQGHVFKCSESNEKITDKEFNPSEKWAHAGPIFEEAKVFPACCHDWEAFHGPHTDPMPYEAEGKRCVMYGETPLVAGCRAVVCDAVGPLIEIPDVLMG